MEGPDTQFAEATIDNGSFGTRTIRFETGRLAKQAAGSAVASVCCAISRPPTSLATVS